MTQVFKINSKKYTLLFVLQKVANSKSSSERSCSFIKCNILKTKPRNIFYSKKLLHCFVHVDRPIYNCVRIIYYNHTKILQVEKLRN